jgi:hypothetical protein
MTREELWNAYCKRNPSFAGDGEVTMSARGLKKLFDKTWEIAQQQKPSSSDGKDLFDTLFGGKMR